MCHVVKSWDGGDNNIDNTTLPDEWKRKRTDTWNQELDKGKVNGTLLLVLHTTEMIYQLSLNTCVGKKRQDSQREGVPTEESFSRVPEQ